MAKSTVKRLDEVIQLTKQALENVNPDKRVCTEFRFTVEQVKQLLGWLEEYHKIKEYWLPSDEEKLRKERGECNNLYDKIDIVVSGLYSAIADQIIEKSVLENKYKRLEADCTYLDNKLRASNTENDELKRLLRLAVEDFETAMLEGDCEVCALRHCSYGDICKWRHHDEAMKLLGGADNVEN